MAVRHFNTDVGLEAAFTDVSASLPPQMMMQIPRRMWRLAKFCANQDGAHADALDPLNADGIK
jgi:hypothetical protein